MKPYIDAALAADRLCLGSHWIYDQAQLATAFPDGIHAETDPLSSYHPNRKAGQNTHIGDQLSLLSTCVETHNGYNLHYWRDTWLTVMQQYDGYIDGATKATLTTEAESPSGSNEFSVVSRIAPILDLGLEEDRAVSIAQSQAALTHGGELIPEVVEFFVRVIYRIQAGASIVTALIEEAATDRYSMLKASEAVAKAQAADPEDFLSVASDFGQACSLDAAFPLTLYFVIHHSDSFAECLSKNALAGGDNTARGMVLALLLTAQA